MDRIPDHIVVDIFSYLSNSPADLLRVRQVCTRWKYLADLAEERLWGNARLCVSHYRRNGPGARRLGGKTLLAYKCLTVSRFVGTLSLRLCQRRVQEFIMWMIHLRPCGTKTKTLELHFRGDPISVEDLLIIFTFFPEVRELEFRFMHGRNTTPLEISFLPKLERLSIHCSNAGFELTGPIEHRPKLKVAIFDYNDDLSEEREGNLLRCAAENLKILAFGIYDNMDLLPTELQDIRFPNVVTLDLLVNIHPDLITQAYLDNDKILGGLESFSSVTLLKIIFAKDSFWFLSQLLKKAPRNLRQLFVIQEGCVTYHTIEDRYIWLGTASQLLHVAFSNNRHLKHISAEVCIKFLDDEGVRLVPQRFPNRQFQIMAKENCCFN